jgi:hypothetical protein
VRLALKVIMQNDGEFLDVILLYTRLLCVLLFTTNLARMPNTTYRRVTDKRDIIVLLGMVCYLHSRRVMWTSVLCVLGHSEMTEQLSL